MSIRDDEPLITRVVKATRTVRAARQREKDAHAAYTEAQSELQNAWTALRDFQDRQVNIALGDTH